MTTFLKLTHRIINVRQISEIIIKPKSYNIYFSHTIGSGGFLFAGSGFLGSIEQDNIIIDQDKDIEDYKTVSEWIKKID